MNKLKIAASPYLAAWLAEQQLSIAFSSYQAGKLFLLGRKPEAQLAIFERTFNRCMGLWSDGQTLWAATAFQLLRFENILAAPENGFDRLFVPRIAVFTGDIDVHDLAVDEGQLFFVSTLFSAIATRSDRASFKPYWTPSFITRLAPEDRCHLNGMALRDGQPFYATAAAASDDAEGWRTHALRGGCLIDIPANKVILEGLSMPHSPRWHNGKLWLLDSGNGYLGFYEHGIFTRVAFLPGYARGLALVGNFAVVGVSKPRHEPTFAGLSLEKALQKYNHQPRCGLAVVDLTSGALVHWLWLEDGQVNELYDVALIPGVSRPKLLGLMSDEIRYTVNYEGSPSIWRGQSKNSSFK